MDVERYRKQQQEREKENAARFRELCITCFQPGAGCYCPHVQRFSCGIDFVVLIHPIEKRRRIATGRMSYLCLENSHLILGQDYSQNKQVNELLERPEYFPVVLYPGATSQNLTHMTRQERQTVFPKDKKPLIFVIDGTWNTARKMMHQSQNLKKLPRLCFSPSRPSLFRVRKQPTAECYSTIEAIHHTIELLGDGCGFDTSSRQHDVLLHVFEQMVVRQLEFINESHTDNRRSRHRQAPA